MSLNCQGSNHARTSIPNQDYVSGGIDSTGRYKVIVLADGVSSCRYSGEGARIACIKTKQFLLDNAQKIFGYKNEVISEYVVGIVCLELSSYAERNGGIIADYSSTLSAVLYDSIERKAVIFHLGDGLILLVNNCDCRVVGVPSNNYQGTPVTTTEDVFKLPLVSRIDVQDNKYILICSDGAWEHMYSEGLLKSEISNYITSGNFAKLDNYIINKKPEDDYSYVVMDL